MARCPRCGGRLKLHFHYFWGIGGYCDICRQPHYLYDIVGDKKIFTIIDAMLEAGQKVLDEVGDEEAD